MVYKLLPEVVNLLSTCYNPCKIFLETTRQEFGGQKNRDFYIHKVKSMYYNDNIFLDSFSHISTHIYIHTDNVGVVYTLVVVVVVFVFLYRHFLVFAYICTIKTLCYHACYATLVVHRVY